MEDISLMGLGLCVHLHTQDGIHDLTFIPNHMQKQEHPRYSPGGGFTVTNALTLLSTVIGVLAALSNPTKVMVIPNVVGSVGELIPGGVFWGSSAYTI